MFRVSGYGLGIISSFGFRVYGSRLSVQRSGFMVYGLRFIVDGLWFMVWGQRFGIMVRSDSQKCHVELPEVLCRTPGCVTPDTPMCCGGHLDLSRGTSLIRTPHPPRITIGP